jgi:tRNA(Arg) A34 adenosine deaminase TadA
MVVAMNDPTMHAEVSAIRTAAKNTNNYLLEGFNIYCSC